MPTRRVIHRPDRVVADDAQLIVRFGRDVDVQNALRIALGVSGLYRVVPGYEASGAVCVSAFLVANEDEAVMLLTDTTWDHYGLCTAGVIRAAGYDIIGTDVETEGVLEPHSDVHVDIVVCPYPPSEPLYNEQLPPAERRRIRSQLLDAYDAALRVFDPRRPQPNQDVE